MSEVNERRYYVDGGFGQTHVRESAPLDPSSKPPLVCFHQSPISGAQYAVFQQIMARDRRVLCPDTPGFGNSDPPPSVPTIADYAGAMAVALENLGFAESDPIDVLGFHTGTLIAVELAALRPDLVRRVVLSSLALFSSEELARNKAIFAGPRPLFTDPDYVARYFKAQVTDGLPDMTNERRFELFVARLQSGSLSWYGPEAVFGYDTAARLPEVAQPTLLLVLEDTLSDNTRRAASLLPSAVVRERLDIHGPSGWDAHATEIAEELRAFLDDPG